MCVFGLSGVRIARRYAAQPSLLRRACCGEGGGPGDAAGSAGAECCAACVARVLITGLLKGVRKRRALPATMCAPCTAWRRREQHKCLRVQGNTAHCQQLCVPCTAWRRCAKHKCSTLQDACDLHNSRASMRSVCCDHEGWRPACLSSRPHVRAGLRCRGMPPGPMHARFFYAHPPQQLFARTC